MNTTSYKEINCKQCNGLVPYYKEDDYCSEKCINEASAMYVKRVSGNRDSKKFSTKEIVGKVETTGKDTEKFSNFKARPSYIYGDPVILRGVWSNRIEKITNEQEKELVRNKVSYFQKKLHRPNAYELYLHFAGIYNRYKKHGYAK